MCILGLRASHPPSRPEESLSPAKRRSGVSQNRGPRTGGYPELLGAGVGHPGGRCRGSEHALAPKTHLTPHPVAARHPPTGSSWGAVSRLLGLAAPGPSGTRRAISMATWPRAEPRTSAWLLRLLTRLPLGKWGHRSTRALGGLREGGRDPQGLRDVGSGPPWLVE